MADGRNPALGYTAEDEIRWLAEDLARVLSERLTPGAVDWGGGGFKHDEGNNWAQGPRFEGRGMGGPVPGSYSEGAIGVVKDILATTFQGASAQDASEYLQKIYGYERPAPTGGVPEPGATLVGSVGGRKIYTVPQAKYGGRYYPSADAVLLPLNAQGGYEPPALAHEWGHATLEAALPQEMLSEYREKYDGFYDVNRDEQFARIMASYLSGVADSDKVQAEQDKQAGTFDSRQYKGKMTNMNPQDLMKFREEIKVGLSDFIKEMFVTNPVFR